MIRCCARDKTWRDTPENHTLERTQTAPRREARLSCAVSPRLGSPSEIGSSRPPGAAFGRGKTIAAREVQTPGVNGTRLDFELKYILSQSHCLSSALSRKSALRCISEWICVL